MNCNDISKYLSDYLDDALTDSKKAEIENHLNSCKSCAEELEDLKMTVSALKLLPQEPMPKDAAARLRLRLGLDDDAPRSKFIRFITSPVVPVAAVIVIIFFAFVSTQDQPTTNMLSPESALEKADTPILADLIESNQNNESFDDLAPSKEITAEPRSSGSIGDSTVQEPETSAPNNVSEQIIMTDNDYSKEDLNSLFDHQFNGLTLDFDKRKKKLLESNSNPGNLGSALDFLHDNYSLSMPVYIERAKYQGTDAWVILYTDNETKRIIIYKASE